MTNKKTLTGGMEVLCPFLLHPGNMGELHFSASSVEAVTNIEWGQWGSRSRHLDFARAAWPELQGCRKLSCVCLVAVSSDQDPSLNFVAFTRSAYYGCRLDINSYPNITEAMSWHCRAMQPTNHPQLLYLCSIGRGQNC